MEQKCEEISHDIQENMKKYTSNYQEISQIVIDNFCSVEPPEIESNAAKTRGISFKHDTLGKVTSAKSVKPGNISLNWKKLLLSGAESTFHTMACISNPILIPLAAIIIWNKIWTNLQIDLDQRHATVLWTMWHNCDNNKKIDKIDLLSLVNEECQKFNIPILHEKELSDICHDLERIKCIEDVDQSKRWFLIEKANIPYL